MPKDQEQLAVRRHDRRSCDLPGRLRVAERHASQIALSGAVTEADGSVRLRVIDCGDGGLGLRSPLYLPRGAEATVTLELTENGRAESREFQVRVQRTTMIDRSPAYYLGTSFVDASAAAPLFDALFAAASSEPAAHSPAARADSGGAAA